MMEAFKEINSSIMHDAEGSRMSFYALIPTFLTLAKINSSRMPARMVEPFRSWWKYCTSIISIMTACMDFNPFSPQPEKNT
jgi:hypothetical protein